MKVDPYLHAVLVLHGAGKEINKENIINIIKAAGIETDEAKAKVLSEALKEANFEELLKQAAVAPAAAPAAVAPAEGEKKEEKKKEEEGKEEAASEGLASLFG